MSLPRGLRAARRSTVSDANIRPDAHALVRPELIFQAAALNLAQLEKLLPVACVQFWGGSAQALVTKQRMPQLTLIGTFLDVWSGRMNHPCLPGGSHSRSGEEACGDVAWLTGPSCQREISNPTQFTRPEDYLLCTGCFSLGGQMSARGEHTQTSPCAHDGP